MTDSSAVIILGMHRSGTSALAGLLAEVGVHMGSKLYKAQAGVNEKGFFENADVVELNDLILDRVPTSWDSPCMLMQERLLEAGKCIDKTVLHDVLGSHYADQQIWGIKDPRLSLTLPLWQPALRAFSARQLFILCFRHPGEVAASLMRRDAFSREKSAFVWLNYSFAAWMHTRDEDRCVVTYDSLLTDPGSIATVVSNRLAKSLGVPEEVRFVDGALRRNKDVDWGGSPVEDLSARTYRMLTDAPEIDDQKMQSLFEEYQAMQSAFSPAILEHLNRVQQSEVRHRRLFEEAYYSWWWKLARPLKKIEEWVRAPRFGVRNFTTEKPRANEE